jgi:hypothetical protein
MYLSIGVSAFMGWFLILCLLFSIQDYDATIGTSTGQPVAQIFLDTVGEGGAIALLVIVNLIPLLFDPLIEEKSIDNRIDVLLRNILGNFKLTNDVVLRKSCSR